MFCEKGVVRNFTKFTRKHLVCQSLLFNKVAGFFHRTPLVAASVLFQSILLVLTKFSFWQENWGTNLSFYDSSRVSCVQNHCVAPSSINLAFDHSEEFQEHSGKK